MVWILIFIFIINAAQTVAMENPTDAPVDQLLQQEAESYLRMCESLRDLCQEEELPIKIDFFTKLIENRLKNNISLDIVVRIPYEGSPKVPLYITAGQDPLISITKKLLKLGANPNGVTSEATLAPLIAAVDAGAVKTVKVLLKAGADPNAKGVLEGACKSAAKKSSTQFEPIEKYIKNIRLLLKHGASPQVTWKAFITPTIDITVSPLLYVMEYMHRGAIQVMRRLLKAGADPNYTVNTTKESLLHFATWFTVRSSSIAKGKKYAKAAKLLLQHGANPNLQDKNGKTPLFNIKFAIVKTDLEIFKVMFLFGADTATKDNNEHDVLAYAQRIDNPIEAQFLQDWVDGKIKFKKKKIR